MSKTATSVQLFAEKIEGSEKKDMCDRITASYLIAEVRYYKDGVRNSRTGEVFPRGYRLTLDIRDRGESNGIQFESFMLFDNISLRCQLEDAKMFSAKKLAALAASPAVLEQAQAMKAGALAKWHEKHKTVAA